MREPITFENVDSLFEGILIRVVDPEVTHNVPGWRCRSCGWTVGTMGLPPWHQCRTSETVVQSPAETALDNIAELCGCPEWDYPGQVVNDVRALKEGTAGGALRLVPELEAFANASPEDLHAIVAKCSGVFNSKELAEALKLRMEQVLAKTAGRKEGGNP